MSSSEPSLPKAGANQPPLVGVLAVVGVGLIGGSFAAALRRSGSVGRILGVGRERAPMLEACRLGLIDEVVTLEEAARLADLIFLAVPVGAMQGVFEQLAPHLRDDVLITDGGSTKGNVVAAASVLKQRLGQFVPGHPIAGSEATGPAAADYALYHGRTVVLTPLPQNTEWAKAWLRRVWEACGARVVLMSPTEHDAAMASVSHAPHFLASVFMKMLASAPDSDAQLALAGSGFRDFTRIAAGSPEVWRDIFLANRHAVLNELAVFREALEQAEQSLQKADAVELYDFLERAALARRFWGSRSGLT